MPFAAIADVEIDPDSPVTTSLMQRLRDNPTAIANAEAGAPQIQWAALNGAGIMYNSSNGEQITVSPLPNTPNGNLIHLIFVNLLATTENIADVNIRMNGIFIFNLSTTSVTNSVFSMRPSFSANAQTIFTFERNALQTAVTCTVVSFAA